MLLLTITGVSLLLLTITGVSLLLLTMWSTPQAKNKSLKSRAAQLERQIKVLIDDSVTLLKARIAELGMAAANPEDLLNRAKVC